MAIKTRLSIYGVPGRPYGIFLPKAEAVTLAIYIFGLISKVSQLIQSEKSTHQRLEAGTSVHELIQTTKTVNKEVL